MGEIIKHPNASSNSANEKAEPKKDIPVILVRRALVSLLPQAFLSSVIGASVFALLWMFTLEWSAFSSKLTLFSLGILFGIVIENIFRVYHYTYYFDQHLISKGNTGRVGPYKRPALSYVDIESIIVQQSLWAKIFNYGSVLLVPQDHDLDMMVIEGVRNPKQCAQLISDLQNLCAQEFPKHAEEVNKVINGKVVPEFLKAA